MPLSAEERQDIEKSIPNFSSSPKLQFLAEKHLLPQQNDVESFENPGVFAALRRQMFGSTKREQQLIKRQQEALVPFEQEQLIQTKLQALLPTMGQVAPMFSGLTPFTSADQPIGYSGGKPVIPTPEEMGYLKANDSKFSPLYDPNQKIAPVQNELLDQAMKGQVVLPGQNFAPPSMLRDGRTASPKEDIVEVGGVPYQIMQGKGGEKILKPLPGTEAHPKDRKSPLVVSDENRLAKALFEDRDYIDLAPKEKAMVNAQIQADRVALAREGGIARAQGALAVPERVSPAERKELGEMRASMARFSELKTKFNKEWVGPVAGRWGALQEQYGGFAGIPGLPQEQANFYTSIAAFNNKVINLLSGANVPPQEFARIVGELPRAEQPEGTFQARMTQTEKNLRERYDIFKDVLTETGADTKNLKGLPSDKQRATAPTYIETRMTKDGRRLGKKADGTVEEIR